MANTHTLDLESSSSQYAYVADSASLSITGDMTIEMWIKPESLPSSGNTFVLINKANFGGNLASYQLDYNNNAGTYRFRFGVSDTGANARYTEGVKNFTMTAGVWYHLAVVYTASTGVVEFYVDGLSQGTATGLRTSIYDSTTQFNIGSGFGGTAYYDGLIDDVRVWSDKRTTGEIQTNIGTELVGNEGNLVGYWKFNNSALDETANNNDLTLVNSPTYSTTIPWSGELLDVANDATLATNLVSYWELEETSGTRVDSHGSNDLADNNTVLSATGIIGNGADFEVDNTEFLSIADASQSGLDVTTAFSVSCWFKPETLSNDRALFSKWNGTGNQRSYAPLLRSDGSINMYLSGNGSSFPVNNFALALATGSFQHVVLTYNSGEVCAYKNGALIARNASGYPTSLFNSSAAFQMATYESAAGVDGVIDEFAFYSRTLTAGEVRNLYNGGAALPYIGSTAYSQDIDEVVTMAEVVARSTSKRATDVITAVEVVSRTTSKRLTDVVTMVDTTRKALTKTLTDAVTMVEVLTKLLSRTQLVQETMMAIDTVTAKVTAKVLTDAITATDTVLRYLSRTITDAVTMVETVTKTAQKYQTVQDTIDVVDNVIRNTSKQIEETITAVETVTRQFITNVVITATVTMSEVVAVANAFYRALTDSTTVTDTLSKILAYGWLLTETIAVQDRLRGLLNGVNMLYNNKYVNKAVTYAAKYSQKAVTYYKKYIDPK